jgi:anti-sigma regulatory factor (Ser/Thr protein kinase)
MDAIELTLPAAPTAANEARTEVTERLAGRIAGRVLEDVRLLVTELITNALRHSSMVPGDRVFLKAMVDDGAVRIEVRDPGRNGEVAPREPGPMGGGYGLFLVEQLARRWGVERRNGTVVWCELPSATAR